MQIIQPNPNYADMRSSPS